MWIIRGVVEMCVSGWIVAAGVPGVAAADTECAAECPAEGSVFLNSKDHVLAAGGVKAAIISKPGTDGNLVAADKGDKQGGEPHGLGFEMRVGDLFGVAEFEFEFGVSDGDGFGGSDDTSIGDSGLGLNRAHVSDSDIIFTGKWSGALWNVEFSVVDHGPCGGLVWGARLECNGAPAKGLAIEQDGA
jgi:hypothetical protein